MEERITPEEITSDINNMKQYLKDIYLLEKELYCSKQAKQEIVNKINNLGIEKNIEAPHIPNNMQPTKGIFEYIFCILVYGIGGGLIGIIPGFLIARTFDDYRAFIVWGIIIAICAILGVVVFVWKNISDNQYYKSVMSRHEREIEKDKERARKELERVPAYKENEKLYAQNISDCLNTLKQLYALDIIFPKYRNFVAISQIYEYFMSGRCTELEGHEGAYNIYENELRQNIIIIQLNEVLANLEEIKQTQYMIYDAICEANSRLAQIESNTEAIAYNTSVIAENSAICARYCN